MFFITLHFYETKFLILSLLILNISFITIIYIFFNTNLFIFLTPFFQLNISQYFIFTDINEIFYIKLINSFYFSLFLLFPWNILILYFFSSEGFYKNENIKIFCFFIFFFVLYCCSFYFTFYYFLPSITSFFFDLSKLPTQNLFQIFFEPKLIDYLRFSYTILLYAVFFFQYPFLIYIYLFITKTTINQLMENRKYLLLPILFFSVIVTPPDIISQIIFNIPLILILESCFFLITLFNEYFYEQELL